MGKAENRKTTVDVLKTTIQDKKKLYGLERQSFSGVTTNVGISNLNSTGDVVVPVMKLSDLGTFSGNFVINFNTYNDRDLTGNVNGDANITFTNIPTLLLLRLRVYIRTNNPTITIGGTIISGTNSNPALSTVVDDFLDIVVESTDQSTITIISVKKNDESDTGSVVPSVPRNILITEHTTNSVKLIFDIPTSGTLPLTYDVLYSTSPDETNGIPDSPITDSSTLNLINDNITVTGLTAATTILFLG